MIALPSREFASRGALPGRSLSTTSHPPQSLPFAPTSLCCNESVDGKPVSRARAMVQLRFNYAEIMDSDHTAITIEVIQNGEVLHAFRNYSQEEVSKEVYANQSESFQVRDVEAALAFVRSNPEYRECGMGA